MLLWRCLFVPLLAVTVVQQKPDFSGDWILLRSRETPVDAPFALTVRRSFAAPSEVLLVDRRSESGLRSESHRIGLSGGIIGGVDRSGRAGAAGGLRTETRFSVRWRDDSLVIENGRYAGPSRESGPYEEHEEVWSLDAEGRLLIVVTDRESGAAPRTMTLAYRRQ